MASVTLDNVKKSFGPLGVIHGVSVDIEDGEFVVIVGPSGCGKSTLLRMVAGLEDVSSGTISIGGRSVENLGPKDRDIAMVFQNYALYPHMSVYDNMAYGLKMRRVPKAEIAPRVKRASEILEITEYLDRKPRALSGGQRQRVAMGRAIVRDPAAFLFDEPLSNLDAKLRVQMRLEIKALQQTLGTTSIYVTHDQVEAMTLADRLIVMNKGNAEQIGPPMEVYENPATTFVAGFIGSPAMNFFKSRISIDHMVEVDAGSAGVYAIALAAKGLEPGRPVLLGIRPEHWTAAAEGAGGAIPLDVHVAEPLGADTLLYGRVGSHPKVMAARLAGHQRNVTGRRAWFTAATEHCFLFDAATGVRLR